MAAHRFSHSRRQAVLRRHVLSAERRLRASQLPPRAAEHCQRVQRKARRRGRAGQDGRERDRAIGVVRRTQRKYFGQRGPSDRDLGAAHVRSTPRRLRAGAEVPSPLGARSADRALCADGQHPHPNRTGAPTPRGDGRLRPSRGAELRGIEQGPGGDGRPRRSRGAKLRSLFSS